MSLRVAINGFGRIGKAVARILLDQPDPNIQLVAINDHGSTQEICNALQYDSVHGRFAQSVARRGSTLVVGRQQVVTFQKDRPEQLPWRRLKINVVIESTGQFTHSRASRKHLRAGARRVLLSAFPEDGKASVLVQGLSGTRRLGPLLSHASCTTTAVAPIIQRLTKKLSVSHWSLFGVQSVTHSQTVVDKTRGTGRRGRQALDNIIPVDVDAARAVPAVLPKLARAFVAQGVRVPTSIVHFSLLTFVTKRVTSLAAVNRACQKIARDPECRRYVAVTTAPVVSQDFCGNTHSATIDLSMTKVAGGRLVQLGLWYDNEWAFATRLVELLTELSA